MIVWFMEESPSNRDGVRSEDYDTLDKKVTGPVEEATKPEEICGTNRDHPEEETSPSQNKRERLSIEI